MSIKRTKNQIRRSRVKQKKLDGRYGNIESQKDNQITEESKPSSDILIEEDKPELQEDALYLQYQNVFNRFNDIQGRDIDDCATSEVVRRSDDEVGLGTSDQSDSEEDTGEQISRKKLRKQNKLPLATLKTFSNRPEVVEWFDADARDPYILVAIKSQLNVVPVPAHWSSKREYLSSRRGFEKPPFQLPDYIKSTGIEEMRNENSLTLRQAQRERVQPKSGRLDIDYQKMHDAFFKFQKKPQLLGFGDVYYEGRETVDQYLNDAKKARPGVISKELRAALGLPEDNPSVPPPWIANMNILGKPPAYSNMVIPGLDCEYSADGYKTAADFEKSNGNTKTESSLWGSLENVDESSEEFSESDVGDEDSEQNDSDLVQPNDDLVDSLKNDVNHYTNNYDSQYDTTRYSIENLVPGEQEWTSKERQNDETYPKTLYTVVEPEDSRSRNGLFENKGSYKLAKEETILDSGTSRNQDREHLISEGEDDNPKFKF